MAVTNQQLQARFRTDTADVNTAATFPVALNASWRRGSATAFRLRFTIQATGASGTNSASTQNLLVSKNGGAYTAIGGTTGVLASSAASSTADNAAITSQQLGAGTGTFQNGQYDNTGATSSFTLTRGNYTEVEFGLALDLANLATGDTLDFRVYRGASPQDTYTATPRLTVLKLSAAAGAYTLSGVAASFRRFTLSASAGSYTWTIADTITRDLGLDAATGAYTLSGVAAALSSSHGAYSLTCAAGAYSLTGTSTGLVRGRTITATAGSYSLSGVATVLTAQRKLSLTSGSYTLTGTNTGLTAQRKIAPDAGAYSLSGVSAGLTFGRRLAADTGTYVLNIADTITFDYGLNAATGVYTLSGVAATLTADTGSTYTLVCDSGSYTISGADSVNDYTLFVDTGSYVITGPATGLTRSGRTLTAAAGSYSLTGTTTRLAAQRKIAPAVGSYNLTGSNTAFLYRRGLAADTGLYHISGQDVGTIPSNPPASGDWIIRVRRKGRR